MNDKKQRATKISSNWVIFTLQINFKQKLEDTWASIASQISSILSMESPSLPEEEHPLPFDAASDKPMEQQKYENQLLVLFP